MLIALIAAALAAPHTLNHQGRLVDALGQPIQGEQSLTIGLYSSATGGTPVWNETDTVVLDNGYFSTLLGDDNDLTSLSFATSSYWVGVTIDGVELEPRVPLSSAPSALSVSGGGVAAQSGPLQFGRTSPGRSLAFVEFPRPFASLPVVVTTMWESDASGPATQRINELGRHGFGMQTYDCSDANAPDGIAWVAIEPGVHTLDGHVVQAGRELQSATDFSITFPQAFSELPVVLLEVDVSPDNSGATACRVESLSTTTATGRCWSLSSTNTADILHWIALEPTGTDGIRYGSHTLYAGRDTDIGSSNIDDADLPVQLDGAPLAAIFSVEAFGVTSTATTSRWLRHPSNSGAVVRHQSYHCAASSSARVVDAQHWLVVD